MSFLTGRVVVGGGLARLDLPEGFRYLEQADARFMVENVWRNPPRPSTLGLVLPPNGNEWGVIVSYQACGHVDDDAGLDADVLLAELRDEVLAANPVRKRMAQPEARMTGWADPPAYDAVGKKLRWGKVLAVEGLAHETVNYEARMLGAAGILSLQAVADLHNLDALRLAVQGVLDGLQFAPGMRYGDFDPSQHRAAGYGLDALIVSVSARVPLWRVLLKLAIAVAIVLAALWLDARRRTSSPPVSSTS
ncbi:MAG: DUF2167 domain-containing protein [Planctomycetota bacterium]